DPRGEAGGRLSAVAAVAGLAAVPAGPAARDAGSVVRIEGHGAGARSLVRLEGARAAAERRRETIRSSGARARGRVAAARGELEEALHARVRRRGAERARDRVP